MRVYNCKLCFKEVAWIGPHTDMYDKSQSYKWVHSKKNISNQTFESWNPDEPSKGGEACAYIVNVTGGWNDNPC